MISIAQIDAGQEGWQALGLLSGIFLPLIVALVTTRLTASRWQAIILAALAAVDGLLTEALQSHAQNDPFNLVSSAITAVGAFAIGVGLHYGLWKPTGTSSALLAVGSGGREYDDR